MTHDAIMGHQCALALGDSGTPDEPFAFVSCGLKKTGSIVKSQGARGTRSRDSTQSRPGTYAPGGIVRMNPTPAELVTLLPRILGGTPSGTSYPLAETVPEFVAWQRFGSAGYAKYAGCKVNKGTFRSAKGGMLEVELDIQAKTYTWVDGVTDWPSLTLDADDAFMHQEAAVTLLSAARPVDSVEVAVDNSLVLDRFFNSTTRQSLPEQDRIVTVTINNPFSSDDLDLLEQAQADWAAGSVVYTNGDYSLSLALAKLIGQDSTPEITGRTAQTMYNLTYNAEASGSTKELVVTLDSTAAA